MKIIVSVVAFAMTLSFAARAQGDPNSTSIGNAIQELSSDVAGNGNARAVGSFVNFHSGKENTKGSRYFFKDWVKGTVTNRQNQQVAKDNLMFNYDKITHDLYLTDKTTVVQVDKTQIQSFDLSDGGTSHRFKRMDNILPDVFFEELAGSADSSGSGYTLLKLTRTTFKKADFHSDGLVESGNNYDEYVDVIEYYILTPGGKEYKKIELKKKQVKDALSAVKPKVDSFFASHKEADMDETFLRELITAVNG
jgi:hypothetical protein